MNNEKKQVTTIWILTVLIVILIAIVAGLIVMILKSKKDANVEANQQLVQSQEQFKVNEIQKNEQPVEQPKTNETSSIQPTKTQEEAQIANTTKAEADNVNNSQVKDTVNGNILSPNEVLEKLGNYEDEKYQTNWFCIEKLEKIENRIRYNGNAACKC